MDWIFPEYPENWEEISEACKRRDNYKCVNCGQPRGGKYKLHAHHILSPTHGGTHDLENLITLCEACHAAVHPHLASRYGIIPNPLTDRYYKRIREILPESKILETIPDENKPLKRIDLPEESFYSPDLAEEFARQYGGYSAGLATIGKRKVWILYVSKNEDIEKVKNIEWKELPRLEKYVEPQIEIFKEEEKPKFEEIEIEYPTRTYSIEKKKEGCCIIASSALPSQHPDLKYLRNFRDEVLKPTKFGRLIIWLYYTSSPPIALSIKASKRIKNFMRKRFIPFWVEICKEWERQKNKNK